MQQHTLINKVNASIHDAAIQAVGIEHHRMSAIERFLSTGKETWHGTGSRRLTLAQIEKDGIYSKFAKAGLRILFDLLAELLPAEAKITPQITPAVVAERIRSMIFGLVQSDWQAVALRELSQRVFVLNIQGARAALEAELSTGWLDGAWKVLWICFQDHGLILKKTDRLECEGLSRGQFAHVRCSSYEAQDPYSDVIVHEAAHLLHYLKPEHYGLHVRRGQERFVDVEFRQRELFAYACEAYSRVLLKGEHKVGIAFAEQMPESASSFPKDSFKAVAELVLTAARARNGWRVIRNAVVIRRRRRSTSSTVTMQNHVAAV